MTNSSSRPKRYQKRYRHLLSGYVESALGARSSDTLLCKTSYSVERWRGR